MISFQEATTLLLQTAALAKNEEQLKVETERILRSVCISRDISWNPYTLERSFLGSNRRVDVIHGATVIEYEPPNSFSGVESRNLRHAQNQAADYVLLLAEEEGRALCEYTAVAWDGASISFGSFSSKKVAWEPLQRFDEFALDRLVTGIKNSGQPLVSPLLLRQFIGPDTEVGRLLIPTLYNAIIDSLDSSPSTRTKLIFTEWSRLFGQVDGAESGRLSEYLRVSSELQGVNFEENPQAFVFALSTYIAVVAKVSAAFALLSREELTPNFDLDAREFLISLEHNDYFQRKGIKNMLSTDFFSWYLGEDVNITVSENFRLLFARMKSLNFDITRKNSKSVRDLFKGLYMEFTPSALRHALGEYYTPDWLASHVMDTAQWKTSQSMLDPTCGSGTFILEALRRRLENSSIETSAAELLKGLHGFDLNPLAVLTARASIVVSLSGRFSEHEPVLLPIYLADAINTADPIEGLFRHTILTERGEKTFTVPVSVASSIEFFEVMDSMRTLIDSDMGLEQTWSALNHYNVISKLSSQEQEILLATIRDLIALHHSHWNGIWCLILFDRIMAGCVSEIDMVIGNPPWVKWSHLPRQYAEFIKPLCDQMDVFSDAVWVGGIQSDISTVVTYHTLSRFVKVGGTLAFLITGSVFKNESSQGFRKWQLKTESGIEPFQVELVEDYKEISPFEGVANWPTLLLIKRNNQTTKYPVPYINWVQPQSSNSDKQLWGQRVELQAIPVPGSDAGPWLVGTSEQINLWADLFSDTVTYKARKGVTTDANGIFFVTTDASEIKDSVRISNDPTVGRRGGIAKRSLTIEKDDVFPLLRGRDIHRFKATVPHNQAVVIPQRGMFGDEELPRTRPRTYSYLASFKTILENRSSYRRFQSGKPFWSIWSTGAYTFSPYKVVWKEMSGNRFVAAYVGEAVINGMESKTIVPDHKVYFVPTQTEEEAAYLTGFLNAPLVSTAVSAYASSLSLGTSVVEYIHIPQFDSQNKDMLELVELARNLTNSTICQDYKSDEVLDALVKKIIKNDKENLD